jgi:hypothetical protein
MPQKENPVPLAGGNRAGVLQAKRAVDTRDPRGNQAGLRLRRQRLAQQVHRHGVRVFFELLDELDRVYGLGDDLDHRLERYARLNHDVLVAVGADRFASSMVRLIGGRG